MRMNRKSLDRVVRLAVAFDKADKNAPADEVAFELPADLSTLTDDELAALHDQAVTLFNELYQGGKPSKPFTAEELEILKGLKDAKVAVTAEQGTRAEAAEQLAAQAAELAEGMVDEDEPEAIDEAAAEVVAEAEQIVEEAPTLEGTIVASAPRERVSLRVPVGHNRRPVAPPAERPDSPFRLALGGTGGIADVRGTQDPVGYSDISDAYLNVLRGTSKSQAVSARQSGRRFKSRTPVALIQKNFDEKFTIRHGDSADRVAEVIRAATDETKLTGNSLVAAGGWCAPSETLYDLCQLEGRDGMLSLPEVNAPRGGIRNTLGPDWADIMANSGFCFTEADDETGNYSLTNAVHTLTEGGAGLTSYTITFDGQTTGSIDDDATAAQVQTALEALSNIAPGDVVVTGSTNPIAMQLTWGGAYAGDNVPAPTTTPTGGTGTVVVATVTQGGQPGPKPCYTVDCPEFTDHRMDVCGVCVQAGILLDRAYPEVVRRIVEGAVTAHMHRVDTNIIADIIAGSTAVTVVDGNANPGTAAPLLAAIELQVEGIKTAYRMPRGATLEAVFPFWVRGMIRADLSRRGGVDLLGVSDAQIDAWFRMRGINAQFVYNFDAIGTNPTAWPATVRFLLYPAGTWVRMSSDLITLEMLHDSALNENNNFTAIFTEEGYGLVQTCHVSRVVSVTVCESGATGVAAGVCP
jgi:hypothetical protein